MLYEIIYFANISFWKGLVGVYKYFQERNDYIVGCFERDVILSLLYHYCFNRDNSYRLALHTTLAFFIPDLTSEQYRGLR